MNVSLHIPYRLITLISTILLMTAPENTFAAGECSRKAAEKKVTEVCSEISKLGEDAQKAWPDGLLYQNCGDNYVWIQDTDPNVTMIMHPIKRRLDGKSLKEHVDENKFPLFVEFDKAAKAKTGGAWVDYLWSKPGAEKATAKTSFVKACKAPNGKVWIAGSGVWKADAK